MKSKDQKMRYSRKLENQLCLIFGHIYRLERGLKHINLIIHIYDGHFKQKIRSLDPRVPILWPSTKFGSNNTDRDRGIFA